MNITAAELAARDAEIENRIVGRLLARLQPLLQGVAQHGTWTIAPRVDRATGRPVEMGFLFGTTPTQGNEFQNQIGLVFDPTNRDATVRLRSMPEETASSIMTTGSPITETPTFAGSPPFYIDPDSGYGVEILGLNAEMVGGVTINEIVTTASNPRPMSIDWPNRANYTATNVGATYETYDTWILHGTDILGTPVSGTAVLLYSIVGAGIFDVRIRNTTDANNLIEVTGLTTATLTRTTAVVTIANWPASGVKNIELQVQRTGGATTDTILIHALQLAVFF